MALIRFLLFDLQITQNHANGMGSIEIRQIITLPFRVVLPVLRTWSAKGKVSLVEESTGTAEVNTEGRLQALLDWTALRRNLRKKPRETKRENYVIRFFNAF